MPKGYPTSGRDELSRLLVAIRGSRTQAEAGQAAGQYLDEPIPKSKITRAENGAFPLKPTEADALARACGASEEDRVALVRLTRAAQRPRSKPQLQRNPVRIQEAILRLETESTLIRSWQQDVIIGTVQTRAYRIAITGKTEPDWDDLRARRLALLPEPHRTWRLLMHEKALTWGLSSVDVMTEQVRRLVDVSHMPNVRLGIVPAATVVRLEPPPSSSFHLYRGDHTVIGLEAGTLFLDESALTSTYVSMFDQLERVAVYDDEARGMLARVADDYSALAR